MTPSVQRRKAPLLRRLAGVVFYNLPHPMRRRIVRIATPTYTLGSVVLVMDAGRERLLMLRQPPGKRWTLPAGLLNRREQPIEGARRELAEETGIEADLAELVPANPCAVVHTSGRWVDNVFHLERDPETTQILVDGHEVWDAGWHPVDDLPDMTRATAKLLAHYGLGPLAD
ncbi:NUDIX domain-containing protein [Glycomyces sp. NEAU-S30]|uniref:NUDIX domain-containing protein n=2 Tax=Glycomyces niveus TaxID=2820287 RepID=A0ABS3U0S1_9ACTN|nr:NUDIX domain-containing protein [Glycomyces sp. NEAU-S30]MBO3732366.1 NUDIX domain-containing protein [Glycomyces sp. NEAU-S30]